MVDLDDPVVEGFEVIAGQQGADFKKSAAFSEDDWGLGDRMKAEKNGRE